MEKISHVKFLIVLVVLALTGLIAVGYVKATGNKFTTGILSAQETSAQPVPPEPVKVDDSKNQQNNLKDQQRYLKDLRNEVRDVKREAKTLDTTKVDGLLSQLETCLASLQPYVGTQDFWSNQNSCNSLSQDIQDELNTNLRPIRGCENSKKNVQNRKSEKKNVLSQVKDIQRQDKNADLSGVNAIVQKMDEQFAKAEPFLTSVCTQEAVDILKDVESELNSIFQDAYPALNDAREIANKMQNFKQGQSELKNMKQQCTQLAREFKNYAKEYERAQKKGGLEDLDTANYEELKQIVAAMCDPSTGALTKVETALTNNDLDAYNDARNEFNNIQQDVWNKMNDARQGFGEKQRVIETTKNVMRDLQQKEKELKRMKSQLKRVKISYDKAVKKYAAREDRKSILQEFATVVSEAGTLLSTIENLVTQAKEAAPKDPEAYWYDYQDELNQLQNDFNDLSNRVQNIGDVINQLKGAEKEIARREKDLKHFTDPELVPVLKDLISQAKEHLQGAWTNLVSDPDTAREELQSLYDIQRDWDDTVNEFRDQNQLMEEKPWMEPQPSSSVSPTF